MFSFTLHIVCCGLKSIPGNDQNEYLRLPCWNGSIPCFVCFNLTCTQKIDVNVIIFIYTLTTTCFYTNVILLWCKIIYDHDTTYELKQVHLKQFQRSSNSFICFIIVRLNETNEHMRQFAMTLLYFISIAKSRSNTIQEPTVLSHAS